MDSTLEEAIERCRARYWPEVRHYRELPFLAHEVLQGRMSQTMVSQHTIVAQLSLQAGLAITSHGMPKDLFVCSPTGSGKSLMYQLPAVCLNRRHGGLTIVVSPLRALIRDQVTSMQARLRKDKGKITCVYLSSDKTVRQRERALAELEKPGCALLYVSPETFVNDPTLDRVLERRGQAKERSLGLNLIVVDEAHTVSPWGHEFRLDYYLLGKRIEHLRRGRQAGPVPLACSTATVALDGTGSQADTSVTVSQVVRDLRMNVDLDRSRFGF